MVLYLLPSFIDLENGSFVKEEEPENVNDMIVGCVAEENIPVDPSQSLIVPALASQHPEVKRSERDVSVQCDVHDQPIPVIISERIKCFEDANMHTVDDLDMRPNLEPDIKEITRISNLRNLGLDEFPTNSQFFNGYRDQNSYPSYQYLNPNFTMNQYEHNYPVQPIYMGLPEAPPPLCRDWVRPPPRDLEFSRMHYSNFPRMQSGYPQMSSVARLPYHHRMPFKYTHPSNSQCFYQNFVSHTPLNRPCVSPPDFVKTYNPPGIPVNFRVPMLGRGHNTNLVRIPRQRSVNNSNGSSIQEVVDKLGDAFSHSSITENSQSESTNTRDWKKNIDESAKLDNLSKEKLDTTIDFSLDVSFAECSEDKNSVKGKLKTKSISQDISGTKYTVDDVSYAGVNGSEHSEHSLDFNENSKLPWCELELIDLADVSGRLVEVWHYKDGAYIILQQAASSFMDEEGTRTLVNSIVGQDHHATQDAQVASIIIGSLEKSGKPPPYSLGQQMKILIKKHISLEEDYIILVPLKCLLDVFCIVRENFLVEMSVLMKFVISMLKKHSVAEKSDEDSDSDSDD